jgi:hypothetical protein
MATIITTLTLKVKLPVTKILFAPNQPQKI